MKPSTPYQSDDKKRSSGTSHSTGLNLQKNPGNWTSLGLNPYRGAPSVHFESPDGGHKHHHVGTKSRIAALDVKKLLHANISSESCLSHWKERHSCQNVIPMCPNNKKRNGILLPILQKILTYKPFRADQLERNPVCNDGRVAMGNVGEWPCMDEHWRAL